MGSVPCFALLLLFSVAIGERTERSSDGITSAERDIILQAHNEFRHSVSPHATNMQEMTWSNELEAIAQDYAWQCIFNHNGDRSKSSTTYPYVGENIYVHSNKREVREAVQGWFDERNDYDYNSGYCSGPQCGHYTQVVWAKTDKVGCGVAWCDHIQNVFWNPPSGYLVICDYGPGGNYIGEKPYETA